MALVLSGRAAPSLPRRTAATRAVRDMDDAELVEEMRKLSGTADELLSSPELLSIFLPPMRADYQIVDDYVYRAGPPLSCPVAVLTGETIPGSPPKRRGPGRARRGAASPAMSWPGGTSSSTAICPTWPTSSPPRCRAGRR